MLHGKGHLHTHKGAGRENGRGDGIIAPCLTTFQAHYSSHQFVKGPSSQAQRIIKAQWQAVNPNEGVGGGHTPIRCVTVPGLSLESHQPHCPDRTPRMT